MKSICVVTGSRADYGLLKPVMHKIQKSGIELWTVATGAHLLPEFGGTINEIIADGFDLDAKLNCVMNADTTVGMTKSTAKAIELFADYFNRRRPNMLLLLGDRYEIFACAVAAAIANIPIAHMYGGDTTEGAIDEFFRHSITKMSLLHFVSNEDSMRRVIQLGEHPDSVFNVGSTGIENIKNMSLLSREQLESELKISLTSKYAIITYHPVTKEYGSAETQMIELLAAISDFPSLTYIFTNANADAEGIAINRLVNGFVQKRDHCRSFESLGSLKYLSALSYAEMIIGNSSSGIYEAPSFHIPTINIGDRQKGRLKAKSVIDCEPTYEGIKWAIDKALSKDFRKELQFMANPFECERPSDSIVAIIKKKLNSSIKLKKSFYEIGKGNVTE